jgi:hypothetical protein
MEPAAAEPAAEPFHPANNPIRRAESDNPSWNYAFWPDLERKGLLKCKLCGLRVHARLERLKQQLSEGRR